MHHLFNIQNPSIVSQSIYVFLEITRLNSGYFPNSSYQLFFDTERACVVYEVGTDIVGIMRWSVCYSFVTATAETWRLERNILNLNDVSKTSHLPQGW